MEWKWSISGYISGNTGYTPTRFEFPVDLQLDLRVYRGSESLTEDKKTQFQSAPNN